MKKILLFLSVLTSLFSNGQTYPSQNINLLGMIDPNTENTVSNDNRHYSGCWGWKQTSLNKEYAIVGGSNGTYFIDVTIPSTPSVCAFVPGKTGCTWREIKTYLNYCYVVSDDGAPNTFQIIDMSTLPSTVTLVHNGISYFERAHTIFVDQNKLYVAGLTYSNSTGSAAMNVYSLATPTAPLLLRSLQQDVPSISYVHDMYVRNDTVFASTGYPGLFILKLTATNTFTQIGSFTGYASAGYNHASMLTQDAKHLIFCDEVPSALPIHLVNVQNFSNVQPVQTFKPHPGTTPHNPYLIGNKWALVSCYQDGLQIYDISQPGNAALSGYFDTYPQGGFNIGNYNSPNHYRGNWGAYPYLPSGIIIAVDMQNGIFILDGTPAFNNPVGVKDHVASPNSFIVYPNPASHMISVNYVTTNDSKVQLRNTLGQVVFEKQYTGSVTDVINTGAFANGSYVLSITEKDQTVNKKMIINH
ncbi:MAG: choice-of-anchor B family protein [Bacteroidetes bacterium]|nr:choice-of-anchor B family protein [Bacteroidota bacterium]